MTVRTLVSAARRALIILVAGPLLGLGATQLSAGVPAMMNYQGYLTDADNFPRQGSFAMAFGIFADSTGGSALWTESHGSVAVGGGVFNVILGAVNPLPPSMFSGARLWLETTVSDTTLTPRRPLVSVPYSLRATNATRADTAQVALSCVLPTVTRAISLEIYAMQQAPNATGLDPLTYGVFYPGGCFFGSNTGLEYIILGNSRGALAHFTVPPDYVSGGSIRFTSTAVPAGDTDWRTVVSFARAGNAFNNLLLDCADAVNADAGLPQNQYYVVTLPIATTLLPDDVAQVGVLKTGGTGSANLMGMEFIYTASH